MRKLLSAIFIGAAMTACGATFPVPTQRIADAQAAERSAREMGAADQPGAKLHLKLAQEQIAKAKSYVKDGENKKADMLLVRATKDAELAMALARELTAKVDLQDAVVDKEEAPQ